MSLMRFLACVVIVVCGYGNAQAGVINTVQTYTGSWSPFGEPDTATYGQTFTATSENVIDSFSLYLNGIVRDPVDFKAFLYAWDGTKATGPKLFESSLQSFLGSVDPIEFAFVTGGVTLTPGTQYVAFLNATYDGIASLVEMPYSGNFGSDSYNGGGFVYYNNGNDFSLLTSNQWDKTVGEDDVWFKASFSSSNTVPEPASIAVWSGVIGMGLFYRRKKRNR